MSDNWTFS